MPTPEAMRFRGVSSGGNPFQMPMGTFTSSQNAFYTASGDSNPTITTTISGVGNVTFDLKYGQGITAAFSQSTNAVYTAIGGASLSALYSTVQVGRIITEDSGTSFYTTSDYRLKENVDYDWDATTRLKQLKPARFNFIANATKTLDGFLAHEVSNVVPEAISGDKDAMKEIFYTADDVETQGENPTKEVGDFKEYHSTEIDAQGIDPSKLVPLLVKTIQELEARITAGGL